MELQESFGSVLGKVKAPFKDPLFWAKIGFRSKRAQFYYDLAENMETQKGKRITQFIERYAERYPNEAIGKLAAHWLERYREEGSFSEAVRGTVPAEDIGALLISEQAGDLKIGLRSLSTSISGLQSTRDAMRSVFSSTVFAFIAIQFYIAFYAFKIVPTIESTMPSDVSITSLGFCAVVLHWLSLLVRQLWPLWGVFMLAIIAGITWGVPNYVGKYRGWLDNHVLHFQLYREFHSAQFLTSLAAVTQRINNKVLSIPKALQLMEPDATKWVQSHIKRILVNLEEDPGGKGENFGTGLVNKETHYRMVDIAEHSDMSEMLFSVGEIILKRTPEEMEKRADRISLFSRMTLAFIVVGLQWGFNTMSWNFQKAITIAAYIR